jgi:cytochrome P450
MRALKVRVDELAKIYVDTMVAAVGDVSECDFVQEVAVNYPLYVIMSLLGLPESDFPRMLELTQELFGGTMTSSNAAQRWRSSYRCCSNSSGISMRSPHRAASNRPRTWPPQSPTPVSTANRYPTSRPLPTTSSSLPRVTTPPARLSPVVCKP